MSFRRNFTWVKLKTCSFRLGEEYLGETITKIEYTHSIGVFIYAGEKELAFAPKIIIGTIAENPPEEFEYDDNDD